MEEGIVVEQSATEVKVWLSRLSRVIPVRHWRLRSSWKIGTSVCVWAGTSGEATRMEETHPSMGNITVNGNELKILLQVIFPPKKLLSKVGLKLFSSDIGLISVDESWRLLFEQAADRPAAVYEARAEWCPSSGEFVLMANQELMIIGGRFPTYLTLLTESPWVELIEVPRRADAIFQHVKAEMDPPPRRYSSSSSSSDDELRTITQSASEEKGILYERNNSDSWKVFLLDKEGDPRNQWGSITDGMMARNGKKACLGSSVVIYLNSGGGSGKGVVEGCRVVDHEESVVPQVLSDYNKSNGTVHDAVMLDVAARVVMEVTIGGRKVMKLYNKRVMDIYDYQNILDNVEMRDVVRVIIKQFRIETDCYKERVEWVVHDYGKGVARLPETKKKMRRRMEMERAHYEYRLIEYASEHDWTDNDVLWHYKRRVREEDREEEKKQKWAEAEARRREEEESLRHKQRLDTEEEEEEQEERRDDEEENQKKTERKEEEESLQQLEPEKEEEQQEGEEEDISMIHRNFEDLSVWEEEEGEGEETAPSRPQSPCNSTHSSTHTQVTVIPAYLPTFEHDLNTTGSFSNPSGDSGCRDLRTVQNTAFLEKRRSRLDHISARFETILSRNQLLAPLFNVADPAFIDELNCALYDY